MATDEPLYRVDLTAAEMRLLNGACRPEVQALVDQAIRAGRYALTLTPKQAAFVSKVLDVAAAEKRLVWAHCSVRSCEICGAYAGYAKYKSGRYRGQSNHDKPLSMPGVELHPHGARMSTFSATLGCCVECWSVVAETVREELRTVECELPDRLYTPGTMRWKRYERAECTECGWTGHEGQMGHVNAILSGTYPGRCPKCRAENAPLGRTLIKRLHREYVAVEVE